MNFRNGHWSCEESSAATAARKLGRICFCSEAGASASLEEKNKPQNDVLTYFSDVIAFVRGSMLQLAHLHIPKVTSHKNLNPQEVVRV